MPQRVAAEEWEGSAGAPTGARPGMLDMVGRAKYDAWKALESLTQDEALAEAPSVVDERFAVPQILGEEA